MGAGGVDDARLGLMERGPAVRVDAEPPQGVVGAEELCGLAGSLQSSGGALREPARGQRAGADEQLPPRP